MAILELNGEELKLLTQTLEYDQGRLILEIAHTDTMEYKDYLKEKAGIMEHVLKRLKALA